VLLSSSIHYPSEHTERRELIDLCNAIS
jgi:hypothetical protein